MCKNIINENRKIFRGVDNQFSERFLSRIIHQFTHQVTSFKSRFPRTDFVQISGRLNLSMRRTVNRVRSRPLSTYHGPLSEFAYAMVPIRSSAFVRLLKIIRRSNRAMSPKLTPFFETGIPV